MKKWYALVALVCVIFGVVVYLCDGDKWVYWPLFGAALFFSIIFACFEFADMCECVGP